MDEIEAVEKRAREISDRLGVTYETALMLVMSERGEFEDDVVMIDQADDTRES